MLQRSLFTLTLSLMASTLSGGILSEGIAVAQLPTPNSTGDYSPRTSHRSWIVIDRERQGLNCRWSNTMPQNWYDPSAKLPPLTIQDWRIVRRFKQGTILTSNITPAGFAGIMDTRRKPWLKVSIGPEEQICLVRANAQFIRPVRD
jgi:hypothetical protein